MLLRLLRRCISVFSLALITLLAGCSSQPQFTQDYKPGTTFANHKTYQWRQVFSDLAGLNEERVTALIDHQLSRQGLRLVEANPDVLLDMQVYLQTTSAPSTGIGIGIGLPVGRHGSIGLGSSQWMSRSKQVSVIVLDMTDADSNSLVWRGSANNVPVKQLAAEHHQQLALTLEKLLTQYPPRQATHTP